MNVKKARELRKAVGFVPSDERKYNPALQFRLGRFVTNPRTIVNHETSPRAKYQAAKGRGQ